MYILSSATDSSIFGKTIPKLMNEKNYYTFSMHGNNCTMWNRNVVHEAFGYNKFYCYNKDFNIDEVLGLGLSDKSFFKQAVPKIKDISNKYNILDFQKDGIIYNLKMSYLKRNNK